jgi:transketolase
MKTTEVARVARIKALNMVHNANSAHIGSSLSAIDILSVLYADVEVRVAHQDQKKVVLVSKGHAAAGVYAVMATFGLIPEDLLSTYCLDGGALSGHVTAGDYVEFSTGSLGHALPYAVGRALASKLRGDDKQFFVLLSDGECAEGSNWEAALLAAHHRLSNLKVIIDRNYLQSLTSTEETLRLDPLDLKWKSFGWSTVNIDGHNHEELNAFVKATFMSPAVAVAKTTKGSGVNFMRDSVQWHYRSPNKMELEEALWGLREDA